MLAAPEHFGFASDNTAGMCPEAWTALAEANRDEAASYGEDEWTRRLCDAVREIFECDCAVYLVFNGTAANALSIAHLARSYHSVVCHELAHIQSDECGAPEFVTGGSKLLTISGANGKLQVSDIEAVLRSQRELHSPKPKVLSLTQSTELGTVYTRDELGALCDYARGRGLSVQMDGARFANAVASIGCAPEAITAEMGVDVLSFGGTKNGTAAGEVVVFFNRDLATEFDYRAKQAGQLASKMRFFAAPWLGLLQDGAWLRNAKHANECARLLARKIVEAGGPEAAFPCEANAVFLRLPERCVQNLHGRGWHFYKFIEPDFYRLMCSWSTTEASIDRFVTDFSVSWAD